MASLSDSNKSKASSRMPITIGLLMVALIFILAATIASQANEKRVNDFAKKDIAQINALVESVKEHKDSPAKDYFNKAVNDGMKDGEIKYYEYTDIMEAYSEVMKLEAVY